MELALIVVLFCLIVAGLMILASSQTQKHSDLSSRRDSSSFEEQPKATNRCDGNCDNCPDHYGYRYGRWYYGHGHQHGCQRGGNGGASGRTSRD